MKTGKEFKELETARRRKELEEMLTLPTKSILKKRTDSEDSPSLKVICVEPPQYKHPSELIGV